MSKIIDKIMNFVSVLAEKLTKFKYLMAVAETMQALLGITMIGSFACLFAFIDIPVWTKFLTKYPGVKAFFMTVQFLTLTIISVYVILLLSYLYAEKLQIKEKLLTIPIALAAFLLVTPVNLYSDIPTAWLGHAGLFTAMIIGFIVPRVVKLFLDKGITIKMPAGVPRVVENTFAVLVPAFVICTVFGIIGRLMLATPYQTIHNLIYTLIQVPMKNVGLSFPVYLFYQIIMTLFMFCGVHGTTAVTWMTPIRTAAAQEQLAAFSAGQPLPHIIVGAFENCICVGGIGATLGLGILMFIFAKSKRYKQLSRMAIVPQIFNIGEPFLFGIPIMLNPILFMPYMGGIIINTIVVYIAVATGLCARFTGVEIAWTVPSPIKAFLGCSVPWQGLVLCLIVLAIDMVIWYPFVKLIDKQALAEEKASEESAKEA